MLADARKRDFYSNDDVSQVVSLIEHIKYFVMKIFKETQSSAEAQRLGVVSFLAPQKKESSSDSSFSFHVNQAI